MVKSIWNSIRNSHAAKLMDVEELMETLEEILEFTVSKLLGVESYDCISWKPL